MVKILNNGELPEKFLKSFVSVKTKNIILPAGRVVFESVNTPLKREQKGREGSVDQYSITLIYPEKADLSVLKDAIHTIAVENSKNRNILKSPTFKIPYKTCDVCITRDGSAKYESDFDNWVQLSANTYYAPGISDAENQNINTLSVGETESDVQEKMRKALYPGVWARISVNPAYFDASKYDDGAGGCGVKLYLKNIQIIMHDSVFGRGFSVQDDFCDVDSEFSNDDIL